MLLYYKEFLDIRLFLSEGVLLVYLRIIKVHLHNIRSFYLDEYGKIIFNGFASNAEFIFIARRH